MAPPVIANTYRVSFEWLQNGGGATAANVIHIRALASDPDAVFAVVDGAVTDVMWDATSSAFHVEQVKVQLLDGTSAAHLYDTSEDEKYQGSGSSEWSPASTYLVKLRTALAGKHYRGRVYLPYPGENSIQNGSLENSFRLQVQTGWEAFRAGVDFAGMAFVVASYTLETAQDVTSVVAETLLGTQKRRQDRLRA